MNRKVDSSSLWLVVIKDKDLLGEPYIALSVVEALDEEAAQRVLDPHVNKLIEAGRGRCHAMTLQRVELGAPIKTSRLIKDVER